MTELTKLLYLPPSPPSSVTASRLEELLATTSGRKLALELLFTDCLTGLLHSADMSPRGFLEAHFQCGVVVQWPDESRILVLTRTQPPERVSGGVGCHTSIHNVLRLPIWDELDEIVGVDGVPLSATALRTTTAVELLEVATGSPCLAREWFLGRPGASGTSIMLRTLTNE